MTVVPLSTVLPEADVPEDATVSLEDAHRLGADLALYGNAYVKPAGEDEPTHVRVLLFSRGAL